MIKPCEHCICKTCAIAYINGGAEGCGDCKVCKEINYKLRQTGCYDYYNPEKRSNENAKSN